MHQNIWTAAVAVVADVVAVVADVVVVAYVAVVVVADGIKVTLEKAKLLLRLLHDSQIFLLPPQFSQRGPIQQNDASCNYKL